MKKLLYFVSLLVVAASSTRAQNSSTAPVPLQFTEYFIGKPVSLLPQPSDQVKQFEYDSKTKIFFAAIVGEKLYNILSYNDTVFMIFEVNDVKFSGRESFLYAMYGDSTRMLKFNEAFREHYSKDPDFNTLPLSFVDIALETFSIAEGASGKPTESGKRYLELKKATPNEDQVRALLLSFNPIDRLIGLALFDQARHANCLSLYNTLIECVYEHRYRFGCGPHSMLNAKGVVAELRMVEH